MSNRSETACVICGAPEPMGLSVCPDCGGTAPSIGDTLIFVKPQSARTERWQVANMLDRLLRGGPIMPSDVWWPPGIKRSSASPPPWRIESSGN